MQVVVKPDWSIESKRSIGPLEIGSERPKIRSTVASAFEEVRHPFESVAADHFNEVDVKVSYSEDLKATYIDVGSCAGMRQVSLLGVQLLQRSVRDVVRDLRSRGIRAFKNKNDPYGVFLLEDDVVINPSYSNPRIVDSVALFRRGIYDANGPVWVEIRR